MRLILASKSPRRAELLAAAGFDFDVCPADLDESAADDEQPADYVRRLAIAKARHAGELSEDDAVVIGADTVVVAQGRLMGKPTDSREAESMLRALSGTEHEVLTGVCLWTRREHKAEVVTTRVRFVPLTAEEIAWYLGTGEPDGKAGGYAIQGRAARFVDRIDGSWSNVVGLPIATVYSLLKDVADPD